jgi:hypothetical protein
MQPTSNRYVIPHIPGPTETPLVFTSEYSVSDDGSDNGSSGDVRLNVSFEEKSASAGLLLSWRLRLSHLTMNEAFRACLQRKL